MQFPYSLSHPSIHCGPERESFQQLHIIRTWCCCRCMKCVPCFWEASTGYALLKYCYNYLVLIPNALSPAPPSKRHIGKIIVINHKCYSKLQDHPATKVKMDDTLEGDLRIAVIIDSIICGSRDNPISYPRTTKFLIVNHLVVRISMCTQHLLPARS